MSNEGKFRLKYNLVVATEIENASEMKINFRGNSIGFLLDVRLIACQALSFFPLLRWELI